MVDALVEQAGVDLGGCLVGETRRAQQVQHGLLLRGGQARAGRGLGGELPAARSAVHAVVARFPPADAGPVGEQATRVVERFTQSSDARELRQRLGVLQEDKALLDPEHRGCPPF